MNRIVDWWERYQIPLYLLGIVGGVVLGLTVEQAPATMEAAINPALIALLYATFLGLPLRRLGTLLKDVRFLSALAVLNFVLVPIVVFLLTRGISDDRALITGVALVLLAPCVDYVIVFTGLAGGAQDKLLAAAPVLMLGQMILIPVFLGLIVSPDFYRDTDIGPFIEAFALFILLPLFLAAVTQAMAARWTWAKQLIDVVLAAMVPLMIVTLFVVVASQIHTVQQEMSRIVSAFAIYGAFLIIMPILGIAVARVFRQDVASSRAVVFSGATRNSLVVLPLALALPEGLALAAVAVVAQTLVELIGMVIYVRLVPRLVPHTPAARE